MSTVKSNSKNKTKKSSEQTEWKLYLTYRDSSTGGEICEGEEDESFPNYEPIYHDFKPKKLFHEIDEKTTWVETLTTNFKPIPGKKVFIVIVRYQSGDTFGISHGNWHIPSVEKSYDDSMKLKESIENGEYSGYRPWTGYFEELESVEICPMIVS